MTPPPYGCPCSKSGALCPECVQEQLAWHRGTAQLRGERWARAIADAGIPIDRPWPMTDRMRAGALRKVADLTRDARLRELLADEVVVGAARWWDRALHQAG